MNFSERPLGRVLALAAGTVLTVSCGGDDPVVPATPGEAVVVLVGAVAGDRAILLDVGQGAITVTPGSGELQMHARADGGRFVVAVFGHLDQGPILRIQVSNIESLPALSIREVASDSGSLREPPSSYSLQIEVPPN